MYNFDTLITSTTFTGASVKHVTSFDIVDEDTSEISTIYQPAIDSLLQRTSNFTDMTIVASKAPLGARHTVRFYVNDATDRHNLDTLLQNLPWVDELPDYLPF